MARETKDQLLGMLREGQQMSGGQQMKLMSLLAVPAILAQLSMVMMQYIDAAMVGRVGANAAASIGLVSSSIWLAYGFVMAVCSGFSVQVAHLCGAKDFHKARMVMRQGLTSILLFAIFIALICIAISKKLPVWLGGGPEIIHDAFLYILIYSIFIPISALGYSADSMLQASGNMKVPSIVCVAMCIMDVIFNYIFIFRCGMGVAGAALGTGAAELVAAIASLYYLLRKSPELSIKGESGTFIPQKKSLKTAFGITGPMWIQNIIMRGIYVMSTIIIAPLGAISIAANSFAITAESFCYMPGFGLQDASTTLTGQSLGAGRKDLAKSFAKLTISSGAVIMTFLGILMYIFAPQIMLLLTPDMEVVKLGAQVLRIEAFAETLYAVSIVGYGVCVGAGETKVPTCLNLISAWVVRIGLALILTPKLGLKGYWIAMCIELNVRGILFLLYVKSGRWLRKKSLV